MATLLLTRDEVIHIGLVLRNHKLTLQGMGCAISETDKLLARLHEAYPDVEFLDPKCPVTQGIEYLPAT